MSSEASVGTRGEGNTEPLPRVNKQPNRRKYYCGSIFYKEDDNIGIIGVEKYLQQVCSKYILGKELCPSTQRKHLQAFLVLKKPMRITELKIPYNPHLKACDGNEEHNVTYCSKDGDYIKYGFPAEIKIIKNLRPWQQTIEALVLQEPDDRKVFWFWDTVGNIGKSCLIKYLVVKYGVLFCQGGKVSDIMNLVFNADMDKCRCVVFDIPRVNAGKVSYASLENIKNGMVCNTKYETGVKVFNAPHVICFANFPPDNLDALSRDRWEIVCLDGINECEGTTPPPHRWGPQRGLVLINRYGVGGVRWQGKVGRVDTDFVGG